MAWLTVTMPSTPDILIVGAGLAGTTLAWQLHWRGLAFQIVDDGDPVSSSRIAAGLINPITGQRLAISWRYAELLESARSFYQRVQETTAGEFLIHRPIVRLFQNTIEQDRYRRKARDFGCAVRDPLPTLDPHAFDPTIGGFETTDSYQLLVAEFLKRSRDYFQNRFATMRIDPGTIRVCGDRVYVSEMNQYFRTVIFCQGAAGRDHELLREVPFTLAKGEILTVRIPGLRESRIVNRGVWLAPHGAEQFRVGSTYDRETLDHRPTPTGRKEICEKLKHFVRLPFEVMEHVAAIRPIVDDRKPILGFHPEYGMIGFFNGLGSKGSLQAPFFAGLLADAICGRTRIEAEVDLARWWNRK